MAVPGRQTGHSGTGRRHIQSSTRCAAKLQCTRVLVAALTGRVWLEPHRLAIYDSRGARPLTPGRARPHLRLATSHRCSGSRLRTLPNGGTLCVVLAPSSVRWWRCVSPVGLPRSPEVSGTPRRRPWRRHGCSMRRQVTCGRGQRRLRGSCKGSM